LIEPATSRAFDGAVVPIPTFPLAIKVVNAALLGVVAPIAPGAAQFVVGVELVQVVPFDIKTLPLAPGATASGALVPLPSSTLLAARVVAPVPPLATATVPVTLAEVPETLPVTLPFRLPITLPVKFAVTVPAAKLPDASR
jgi:hypothetical protein